MLATITQPSDYTSDTQWEGATPSEVFAKIVKSVAKEHPERAASAGSEPVPSFYRAVAALLDIPLTAIKTSWADWVN